MNSFSLRQHGSALCIAALLSPLSAFAADLELSIVNAPIPSTLYVALFDSANAYDGKKALASKNLPAQAEATTLTFAGLAPGRYAVKIYADENGNATLDTNLIGMPIERYGFSNDAKANLGPPDFDAAAVGVDADTRIVIKLR